MSSLVEAAAGSGPGIESLTPMRRQACAINGGTAPPLAQGVDF